MKTLILLESARAARGRSRHSPCLAAGTPLCARSFSALLLLIGLLGGCGGLQYPLQEPLTKKRFEPRREPEAVELYFSASRVAKTVRTGGSHDTGDGPIFVDSGSEEVARSYPVPGRDRDAPRGRFVRLRKLRTNLIVREAGEPVPARQWPDEMPPAVLPSESMVEDGLGQLAEMAAESGADAVTEIFAWVVVEESRFGVAGVYEFTVVPKGVVLQGIAVRYTDP